MKPKYILRSVLLFFILGHAIITDVLAQLGPLDYAHRGIYVDRFFNVYPGSSTSYVDEAYSMLGCGTLNPITNLYPKEEALLTYCKENHINYLILYDGRILFNPANLARIINGSTVQDHLCRFMNIAESDYCIQSWGVAVGSGSEGQGAVNYNNSNPIAAFQLTSAERLLLNDSLLISAIEDSTLAFGDTLWNLAQNLREVFSLARFNSMGTCIDFSVLTTEFEFWNTQSGLSYAGFQSLVNAIRPMGLTVEAYLFAFSDAAGGAASPQDMADWFDANSTWNSGYPNIDRVLATHYNAYSSNIEKPFDFSSTRTKNSLLKSASTTRKSLIRPLFSGESDAWSGDIHNNYTRYQGYWISTTISPIGLGTLDPPHARNIFLAEKYYYRDWRSNTLVNTDISSNSENDIHPGATHWFAASMMEKYLRNPKIFYRSDALGCSPQATDNLQFTYCGPVESTLEYEFVIKDHLGTVLFTTTRQANGTLEVPQGTSIPVSTIAPIIVPLGSNGIVLDNLHPYRAELTVYYKKLTSLPATYSDCGQYTYGEDLWIAEAPHLNVIGNLRNSYQVCQEDHLILEASVNPGAVGSITWYREPFGGGAAQILSIQTGRSVLISGSSALTDWNTGDWDYYYTVSAGCGTHLESNHVRINILQNPKLEPIDQVCDDDPFSTNVELRVSSPYAGATYLWSDLTTSNTMIAYGSGKYYVKITNEGGCTRELTTIIQSKPTIASIGNCTLQETAYGGVSSPTNTDWFWYRKDPVTQQNVALPVQSPEYLLSAISGGLYSCRVEMNTVPGYYSTCRNNTIRLEPIIDAVSKIDPSCNGASNGSIDLSFINITDIRSYAWSPGGFTTQNISNLSAGTYTCTVTSNTTGCTASVTVVLQDPGSLTVSLSPTSVNCSIGCDGSITATVGGGVGGYSYSWNNGVGTNASLNNLCPGPYTCVVTDANGCTASASTVLGSTTASCNGSQVQFCTGATASQVLAAGIYAPGTPVSIESDFTVDVDFTFDNSDVAIATGVRILVDPNARLQVINGTVLHACSVSWQRIELKDGTSSLEILTGSTLRDAVVGVLSSTGSAIAIDQANFLHNERSIFLKTVPFPAFSCQRSTFDYGNISFKDPTAFFHIGLENVNGVQIGIPGPGLANDFSHARYCVSANSSDFTLINNNFHDLGYEVKDDAGQYVNIGNAVRAINSPSNQVVIGNSSAPDDHNYFHLIECVGIYVESDLDQLHIRGNEFDKVFRCMDMTGVRNSNVTIYDNKFFSFGLGLLAVEIESSNFTVSENQFNMVSWDPDPTLSVPQPYGLVSRYGTVALSFQNHEQNPATIHCFNNRMANSRAGIHLRNIDGVNQSNVLVEHNQVFYTHPSYISYGIERGIWLEHDEQVDVRNNHIALRDNVPNPDDAFRLTGIQFDFTTSTRIDENYIGNMGYSTKGSHLCQETRLHCNNFDGYSNGVNAYKLSLPTQGDDDILGAPEFSYNNQWNGVQSGAFKIDGSISGLQIPWYYVPGLPDDMSNSNFVVLPFSVGFHSACNVPAPNTPIALRDKKYGDLVRGSAVFTIDSIFAHYYALKQFYGEMKKDTSLLSLGTSDDSLYQQTFNQLASGNTGAYHQVMKLVRSGEYLQADQTLGLIVDSCLPEAYLRDVINIILALRWRGDSLSSQEKIILKGIAMDEGIYGGEATYMARAILKEFFNEEPFLYRNRPREFYLKEDQNSASRLADKVLLSPNPTRSGLRVQVVQRPFDRLMVYNQVGILVDRISLESEVKQVELSLTYLPPGMYYLAASCGEEQIGIARFVKLE